MNTTIHNPGLMPVQKCIAGEEIRNLTDQKLLAIIMGTGVKDHSVTDISSRIINDYGSFRRLYNSGVRELAGMAGIGIRKALRIHAALEMGRRAITDAKTVRHVNSPEAVWTLLLPETAGLQKEEFRVLILNNKNALLRKSVISVGTVSEAIVHPREVFRDAIREGGSGIIVAHNHPSGVTTPSMEDIHTTERIAEAGNLLGIPLLDHVILCDSCYLSMKEEGFINTF